MEQTAVKKLELKLLGIISFDSEELRKKYKHAIDQAKAMEKRQLEDSYCFGILDSGEDGLGFNHYYNETFKSK